MLALASPGHASADDDSGPSLRFIGEATAQKDAAAGPRRARHHAGQYRGDYLRAAATGGEQSLILVSDNNFNPSQFTQFLAFAVADDDDDEDSDDDSDSDD